MGVVSFKHRGNFDKTEKFLKGYNENALLRTLVQYGEEGVLALSAATPKRTGLTAGSWGYEVRASRNSLSIAWTNTNPSNAGTPVVVLLQYGFGTKSGGYVRGQDYINPTIKPIMDRIADAVWREVTKA